MHFQTHYKLNATYSLLSHSSNMVMTEQNMSDFELVTMEAHTFNHFNAVPLPSELIPLSTKTIS